MNLPRINKSKTEYYFKGHINNLNLKLTPLMEILNIHRNMLTIKKLVILFIS